MNRPIRPVLQLALLASTVFILLAGEPARLALANPALVTLEAPPTLARGESFRFTVEFDNQDAANRTGYNPFVDVVFPASQGVSFTSAELDGQALNALVFTFPPAGGCVSHPLERQASGAFSQVCGTPGDQLVVLQLPIGAYPVSAPPAEISVNGQVGPDAPLSNAPTLRARGGYALGFTPANDFCCGDPSFPGSASSDSSSFPAAPIAVSAIGISKTVDAPEAETAAGPGFVHTYTIEVDLPPGQVVNNVVVTDTLPAGLAFVAARPTPSSAPAVGSNGDVVFTLGDLTGGDGVDLVLEIDAYVPEGIVPATTGAEVVVDNAVSLTGDAEAAQPGDPAGAITLAIGGAAPLEANAIAIQKNANVLNPPLRAGSVIEYALDFQVSDFFALDNVRLVDTLGDGLALDPSFAPQLRLEEAGTVYPFSLAPSDYSLTPNADGTTTLAVDISALKPGSRWLGGCVDSAGGLLTPCPADRPSQGSLVYRASVLEEFRFIHTLAENGDPSVDHGDLLNNDVQALGDLLDVTTFAPILPDPTTASDTSFSRLNVARGALLKSVYAINGATSFPTPLEIVGGDSVTFRLRQALPSSDFETLVLRDLLPDPIFDAAELVTFLDRVSADPPPPGSAQFGPADTYRALPGSNPPSLSTTLADNGVSFDFGSYDNTANPPSEIDILLTVTMQPAVFADSLILSNLGVSDEGSTNAARALQLETLDLDVRDRFLVLRKGLVDFAAPNGSAFSPPGTPGQRFATPITSSNLLDQPIAPRELGALPGDSVTFTVVIENHSPNPAFDIQLRDQLPPGFLIPPGGLNLNISRGDARRWALRHSAAEQTPARSLAPASRSSTPLQRRGLASPQMPSAARISWW
ncbi:MAG: DUF11 domain-containing protein [Anaerolineae bacterium]|nr:DUF11 domain-containing protein [Anaerolineae bacterium]